MSDRTAPALRAEHLRVVRAGVQVLDIPSLELATGSVLALIGPNGSGKSTLLKTLAGLLAPASGQLHFKGQPLTGRADLDHYRRRVTMVFQEPLLFDASVGANLESGLRFHGVPGPERRLRVQEVAQRFGLEHLLGRSARQLSGGEAQRASLARAFALRPDLLFLDEPFAALDPVTREALLDDLAGALVQTGSTAVFATHDQGEALRLADSLAVLVHGQIRQQGPALEVINHPADDFVAGFVGMETVLAGTALVSDAGLVQVEVAGHRVLALGQAPLGAALRLGIRPEHVTLGRPGGSHDSARNSFAGTVTRILPRGPYFKVELDCGFFLSAYVTGLSLEELELAPGRAVQATFKATAVHLFRS